MIGPPGSGKSMLAKRLPTILPDLSFEEAIEVTQIFSVAGLPALGETLMALRPFRAPRHTISNVGLVVGGRCRIPEKFLWRIWESCFSTAQHNHSHPIDNIHQITMAVRVLGTKMSKFVRVDASDKIKRGNCRPLTTPTNK